MGVEGRSERRAGTTITRKGKRQMNYYTLKTWSSVCGVVWWLIRYKIPLAKLMRYNKSKLNCKIMGFMSHFGSLYLNWPRRGRRRQMEDERRQMEDRELVMRMRLAMMMRLTVGWQLYPFFNEHINSVPVVFIKTTQMDCTARTSNR